MVSFRSPRRHGARPALATAIVLALAGPVWAQDSTVDAYGVDPRAASALTTMTGVSAEYCKRGSQRACQLVDRLQTVTTRLVVAQNACARGVAQGCEALERGVAEISLVYERFGRGAGLAGAQPGRDAPASTPGQGPVVFGQ